MLRAAWLSGLLCGVLAMVDRPRPSVLLIHADDLGYGGTRFSFSCRSLQPVQISTVLFQHGRGPEQRSARLTLLRQALQIWGPTAIPPR